MCALSALDNESIPPAREVHHEYPRRPVEVCSLHERVGFRRAVVDPSSELAAAAQIVSLPATPSGAEIAGDLPAEIADELGIAMATRSVLLHRDTVAHILARRAPADAAIVLAALRRGTFDPVHCGWEHADRRRVLIVQLAVADRVRWVKIALKCVRGTESRSGTDEIWVSSGHLLNRQSLTLLLANDRFHWVK